MLALGQWMAIHHQYRRRQWPWRTHQLRQIPALRVRGRQLRHILLPPPHCRVGKHLPPPANQRIPLPFILALLNPLAKLRQLWRSKRRCHTLAIGNYPLRAHADSLLHRLIQGIRALGRPLHSSEYKLVTQFSKLVPPRLVPRVRCTGVSGGSNHGQAGAREHIERDPVAITAWAQCGLPVRDHEISAQRDVR
ncbi:hypothetical protein ERJ75_000649700 [Trypanosoma vivax]|nr:hypothetical protein ERJ75_000649700 [Trypanosoma vivax]